MLNLKKRKWQIQHCKPRSLSSSEAADEDGPQLEGEELIDIDEEADLIQAERILVDADYRDKDYQKMKRDENNIAAMAEMMLSLNLNDTEPQPDQSQNPNQAQTDQGEWQVGIPMHCLIIYIIRGVKSHQ